MRTEQEIRSEMQRSKKEYRQIVESLKDDKDLTTEAKRRENEEAHRKHTDAMKQLKRELNEAETATRREIETKAFSLKNATHADSLAFDRAVSELRNEKPDTLVRMAESGVTATSAKAILKAGYVKRSKDVIAAVSSTHPDLAETAEKLTGLFEKTADISTIDWDRQSSMKAKVS